MRDILPYYASNFQNGHPIMVDVGSDRSGMRGSGGGQVERLRVLVTGACGRIGGHVTRAMVEAGHQVMGLDARDPIEPVPGVRYLRRRLEELRPDQPELAEIDTVLHLGALMSWVDAEAEAVMAANVTGTFRLLEAVATRGSLRRLVFASTGEVYPENSPVYLPLDEHHPRLPSTYYGMSKLLGEEMVAFYQRRYGVPATVLRFSHVQDPTELLDPDSFFSGPRFFLRRRLAKERAAGNDAFAKILAEQDDGGEKLIALRQADGSPVRMCILSAPDMAMAVRLAAERPEAAGQTLGVGPNEPVDLADFARALAAGAGLPVAEITVPGAAANYWTLNARARELLGFRPALNYADMVDLAVAAWHQRGGAGPASQPSPLTRSVDHG
jgi:UDP-glucose 4-epimerase